MLPAPLPSNETPRLNYLRSLELLDTPPESEFDDVATLASQICEMPIAIVSLVDADRQFFKARVGVDLAGCDRASSFCAHAILQSDLWVVEDLQKDERFADNAFVTGHAKVRFYAGMPLVTPEGYGLGTLCVLDRVPRKLSASQASALRTLARQVVNMLRLRHDARHDALTGLANRGNFLEQVEQRIARARRERSGKFALMFIDLDRFKLINDSLGHAAGDRLLETIAQRLKQSLRVTDTISRPAGRQSLARLGGDEFTVLLDTVRRSDDVARVAERLMNVIRQPIPFDGQALTTTASIGIVVADDSRVYDSANDLLRDADIAMYRAKAGGKNRYALFDKPMHDAAVARLTLETQLHAAIDRREFALEYQPIVCFKTGQVHGLEALLRWRRQGQLVSPMEFIPVAEDTGAILPIGRWAIEEAVRQMAQWRDRNPGLPAIRMAVNLSRKQLSDPKLVACLLAATQKHGIDPGQLELEITESAVMDNSHDAMQMLHDLRATGAKISMDDFGVGYSSLACLQQFPVDVLKIDRSFIENLSLKHDAEAVIQAMLTLAHGLGLSVVAEGLEAAEQVELLRSLNCDYGQGYFFSRPMWAGDVERYLNEHAAKRAA